MDLLAEQKRRQEDDDLVVFEHGGEVVSFELRKIAKAMSRVGEVVHITKSTAQELADDLDDAYKVLGQVLNHATCAAEAAEAFTKKEWSRLVLDVVPVELERRSLKDSVDRREAIVRTHPDYLEAQAKERHMHWVVADLRTKRERVYGAKRTCLAVLGERNDYHRGSLSGGSAHTQAGPAPKFGQARY